jgi:unsaturated rhamnogalacturonyl hydrolase
MRHLHVAIGVASLSALGLLASGCLPAGLSWQGATTAGAMVEDANLEHELSTSLRAVMQTYMSDHPADELAWDWGEGVLMFGIERAFQVTRDDRYRDYLRTYLRAHARAGIDVSWSDDTTPALAALERVKAGDREFQPLVAQVVDYLETAPRTSENGALIHLGRSPWRHFFPDAWVDSLFHVVPTLIRYSQLTGDPRFRNEAVHQLLLFLRALQDPETGLCTHAFDDRPVPKRVPPFASGLFWARGNGWMLVALVDALAELPEHEPARPELLEGARRLEAGLRRHQDPSGLFHTLLTERFSYQETAGSALILYAMARGLRVGVFSNATRRALRRGASGLLALLRCRAGQRIVPGTSLGTNPIASSYRTTATAEQISYGVGAWLMATSEILALLQNSSGTNH